MVTQDELYALRNAWRLWGPDWNRRIQAAILLGEANAAEALPDLEAVAIENKHPELVKAAIHAIGRMPAETAAAAVRRVLNNTTDELLVGLCLEVLPAAQPK
jgi:HEAT repeat protein